RVVAFRWAAVGRYELEGFDGLRNAVFLHVEVVGRQRGERVAVSIADADVDADEARASAEHRRRWLRRLLLRLCRRVESQAGDQRDHTGVNQTPRTGH